ncbi:Phenylalanine aminomutase (L-beta-phenylalanine forming) [Penicillium alfredii]|uniref:Phenylalanine aminomutase (L-beta-phenylalanine forming) n=1 Tax=Penicillium alfredii TaxID=1506179 RepID=A0A9W9KRC2_9EURO|nr:Phenylalanine aminomutase (L-beta-phenylalanine forming) [Penicillium alfredii]KAJ5115006.1 Phenylalanine aminomutase (L-beta-phenylalanine forming) [Penicillium alfredii]
MAHLAEVRKSWAFYEKHLKGNGMVVLDGEKNSLKLAQIVVVSRLSSETSLLQSDSISKRVQESIDTLESHLRNGEDVYGVNTGCGGNANTRTEKLEMLQKAFLQHHQAGILPGTPGLNGCNYALPLDVVRGAILIRCNSLLRGHSAVRMEVIELLRQALNCNITPLIPLRGSISASGDLSPLSYIGGLVEGNPDIFVHVRQNEANATERDKVVSAADALHQSNITPLTLKAKEALGVMNGTAPSAAAAALTLYDTNNLTILTQLLTAMATEALLGSVDNYHDFISQCRPHTGQMEVANNIRSFLIGSQLSRKMHFKQQGLVQDRYALRTAPQWIGPQVEDLLAANCQITTELNSSTDNPLIDVPGDRFHHGGNFQAASVTSAMEKTRTALVMLGRLVVSQCQEIINPSTNKGLPPNLCLDNPSLSFTCKGIDINMSSYFSELAFLSNSIPSHVHTAEMNNQSVNSLALIAARYAAQSADIVTMMCAAHLYVLCQALDLRALEKDFFDAIKPCLSSLFDELFQSSGVAGNFENVWSLITTSWHAHSESDIDSRCEKVSKHCAHAIFDDLMSTGATPSLYVSVQKWKSSVTSVLSQAHERTHHQFTMHPSTPDYLALSTKEIYLFVRQTLRVPLHRGLVDHPEASDSDKTKKTIGTNITQIYTAISNGRITGALQKATQEANLTS